MDFKGRLNTTVSNAHCWTWQLFFNTALDPRDKPEGDDCMLGNIRTRPQLLHFLRRYLPS